MTILNAIFLFLPSMGFGEIALILFIVVLLFGAKKIPELARGLGSGIREFKEASKEVKKEINEGLKDENNNKA